MGAILLLAAITKSDVAAQDATIDSTTLDPVLATDSTQTTAPQKDPFAPYDVGGPEAIWPYEALTPDEQTVVDRNRDAKGWGEVHGGFATAVLERSMKARAEAAQHELGVDNLEQSGVVP
jgi:hypothetical protein